MNRRSLPDRHGAAGIRVITFMIANFGSKRLSVDCEQESRKGRIFPPLRAIVSPDPPMPIGINNLLLDVRLFEFHTSRYFLRVDKIVVRFDPGSSAGANVHAANLCGGCFFWGLKVCHAESRH